MNTPNQKSLNSDPSASIDMAAALKRTMGDAAFLRQMLEAFADQLPEHLAAISAALDDGMAGDLAVAAHRLKGTALNLSIGPIAESARGVEQIGREERLEEGPAALGRLKECCAEFDAYLTAMDWAALTPAE